MQNHYQLIVIGAGPGGYVAAIKAAQQGLSVALIESGEVGGTCLNRGCIPTKTLMHTAHLMHEISRGEAFGLKAESIGVDFDALVKRRDAVCTQLRTGVEGLIKSNSIDLIRQPALIESKNSVRAGDLLLEADHILIATGSRPALPGIPGIELPNVVTSDDLLTGSGRFYKRLLIIGGGVIGVEFATIYSALGCQVTIIEALDRLLPNFDRDISQNLAMILKKRGIAIYTSALAKNIEQQEDGSLACSFESKEQPMKVIADGILVSVGRRANTDGLLSEQLDLGLDHGRIPVDARMETRIPGIYAIGDVIRGGVQLAHTASAQGVHAVSCMLGKPSPTNLSVVPSCVYTDPEIAAVGITADEARQAQILVKTGKFIMSANSKSVIGMDDRGFIKIIAQAETDIVLGAQLMCSRATDMIGEISIAVAQKMTLQQLKSVIHPHPTYCEAIVEAAEGALGTAVHMAPLKTLRNTSS